MKEKVKWGIIGLGSIAHQFAKELLLVEGAEITAVASRNLDKAKEFAQLYHCKKAYGSYEEIIADAEIDCNKFRIEAISASRIVLLNPSLLTSPVGFPPKGSVVLPEISMTIPILKGGSNPYFAILPITHAFGFVLLLSVVIVSF